MTEGWDDSDDLEDESADASEAESPLLGEAVRLFGVVQEWAKQTFPAPASGHGGPECQWCPLCQFASVLRGERPEVTERVSEAGNALMSAVKAFVEAASSAAPTGGGAHRAASADDAPDAEQRRPRPSGVQKIDLDPS